MTKTLIAVSMAAAMLAGCGGISCDGSAEKETLLSVVRENDGWAMQANDDKIIKGIGYLISQAHNLGWDRAPDPKDGDYARRGKARIQFMRDSTSYKLLNVEKVGETKSGNKLSCRADLHVYMKKGRLEGLLTVDEAEGDTPIVYEVAQSQENKSKFTVNVNVRR